MLKAESQSTFIEQLSALPPRQRMDAFRAIQDPAVRQQVARDLPAQAYSEMLVEAAIENLRQNISQLSHEESDRAA
jgi:DNA-binding MurR/RpiR family transcriptional regulator